MCVPCCAAQVEGQQYYNGLAPDQANLPASVALVGQTDSHTPNLTTQETLDFAYVCQHGAAGSGGAGDSGQAPGRGHDLAAALLQACQLERAGQQAGGQQGEAGPAGRQQEGSVPGHGGSSSAAAGGAATAAGVASSSGGGERSFEQAVADVWSTQARVNLLLRLMGLHHCKDTLVGGPMVRGLSGGEVKRMGMWRPAGWLQSAQLPSGSAPFAPYPTSLSSTTSVTSPLSPTAMLQAHASPLRPCN